MITVHQSPGTFHVLDDEDRDRERFDWGRPTPGSEKLAAALLRDALDGESDPLLARQLADEIVVGLPYADPWVLWSQDLREWAQGKVVSRPS